MTEEQMERAIGFLMEHQNLLNSRLDHLTAGIEALADAMLRFETQAQADRQEIRDAINNLAAANDVTRDLAQSIARLAIAIGQHAGVLDAAPDE